MTHILSLFATHDGYTTGLRCKYTLYSDLCIQADISKAIRWTFTAVAIVLTFGRFYIRWKYTRIYWDDAFNALALVCMITTFALVDVQLEATDDATLYRYVLGLSMTLWTTLYLVKASFLALCWLIFRVSANFRKAWYFVAVYNFLTYMVILLWGVWQCGDPARYADPAACAAWDSDWYHATGAAFEAALHSSSEFFILLLPILWISKLHMSRSEKVGAAAVFAITIVDIIMGLLRLIATSLYSRGDTADSVYTIWITTQAFEPGLAVIVCALPAYTALLPRSRKHRDSAEASLRNGSKQSTPPRTSKSTQTTETADDIREPKPAFMV